MDARLVTFKPTGERIAIRLVKPITVIGRGTDCDLELPLAGISRHHCQIRLDDDQVEVTDLNSSNGTYVNSGQIRKWNLAVGDKFRIGTTTFTVQIDGVPQEILPDGAPVRQTSTNQAVQEPHQASSDETAMEADALAQLAQSHEEEDAETFVEALEEMSEKPKNKTKHDQ